MQNLREDLRGRLMAAHDGTLQLMAIALCTANGPSGLQFTGALDQDARVKLVDAIEDVVVTAGEMAGVNVDGIEVEDVEDVGVDVDADEVVHERECDDEVTVPQPKPKMDYVENVAMGTIVAFRTPNGRVKSAKVINKSSSRRVLKLETSYGAQFVTSYDDVIWVRCGGRWPRGVWQMLKGIESDENQAK